MSPPPVTRLTLSLSHPGLSPLLRAGLGGLAASLHAIGASLPGWFEINRDRVVLDWSGTESDVWFDALFRASFALRDGLIDLPGAFGTDRDLPTRSALQDALRQTFLQHGKSTSKEGARVEHTAEIDGRQHVVLVQRYGGYIHRAQGIRIGEAIRDGTHVALAGWANPGAVHRHVAVKDSQMSYTPETALCACFALVGCMSLLTPGGGILVVPEPVDLQAFAEVRRHLTPRKVRDVTVGGVGDATLNAEIALQMSDVERRKGVGRVAAVLFRSTPWASQQKSRVDALPAAAFGRDVLEMYAKLVDRLPARVNAVAPKANEPGNIFVVPSSLRAFIADNLAREKPWFSGFASARDLYEPDRLLHRRWERNNLGALRPDEANGVRVMTEHLEEAERLLVLSVQSALRRRLGVIAHDNRENKNARENRWARESERWRLAFAGAKTREQLRFALADLWSRAGKIEELARGWQIVLPLVNRDWQAARDLALVALAAYAGRDREESEAPALPTEIPSI